FPYTTLFRSDLAERLGPIAIAGRGDRDERDLDAGSAQPRSGALGLSQREPTAAGADANKHDTTLAAAASWRRTTGGAGYGRTPSAPAPGAGDRSGPRSSALVLETEQVPHRISTNHAVGCRGGLLHADCRQVQQLVQDRSRHRLCGTTLGAAELCTFELG